jgi:stage V sporulation protein G
VNITEVRIFEKQTKDKKLRAFATVTFDNCFVVRDVKIIEGNKGLFVAMPSRRIKTACSKCGHGNVVRSRYCNNCGAGLEIRLADNGSRQSEHRDIAHPITLECRELIQKAVLDAYDQNKGATPSSDDARAEGYEDHSVDIEY